jgi:methionyl-tRNA formyltransferase
VVACGEGSLRLLTVQRAGGKRLDAAAFLLGYPLKPGRKLGLATPAPETKPAA